MPFLQDETSQGLDELCSEPGVRDICSEHDLWSSLKAAVELIEKLFAPVQALVASVDVDPDTDERRIVLDVTADAPVPDLLRRYDDYTDAWVKAVPAEKGQWIRLWFHALRAE